MEQRKDIPAFPLPVGDQECCGRFESGYGGMSLRDYFAAKLAPEILRQFQQDGTCREYSNWREGIAVEAYRIAQEMMEVREKMTWNR